MQKLVIFGSLAAIVLILLPTDALAYIDPGAGSNYLQKVIGGFFAFLTAFKRMFTRSTKSKDSVNQVK